MAGGLVNEIEVLAAGPSTSVQDLVGRAAFGRYGVPESGPLDRLAAEAANLLVGNPPDAALLECTLAGPILRFSAGTVVAVTGADLPVRLEDRPMPRGVSFSVPDDARLSLGERRSGARAYLAVAGGIDTPPVLGSRATDTRSRLGGVDGRVLRDGDRLRFGPARRSTSGWQLAESLELERIVRILPGPHLDRLPGGTLDRLCGVAWTVDPRSDRMGYRLAGPELVGGEVASLGLPAGAVQLPPDGQPIVLLADRQPTGGYAVAAVVISADVRFVGQRLPGERIRFSATDTATATAALAAQRLLLARIGPVPEEAVGWSGSLS